MKRIGHDRLLSVTALAFSLLAVAVPSLAGAAAPAAMPVAEILADTNRDGVVDGADREGKAVWTPARGAIILPNIGDSAHRCPAAADTRFTDAALEACNDAQGTQVRAPENLAPLRVTALPALPAGATGQIVATGPGADKVRIFIRRKAGWVYLGSNDRIGAAELRRGLELGVDARDVARNAAIWDGTATIRFTLRDGRNESSDAVAVRVSPVIVHNHTEAAVDVFGPDSGRYAPHKAFMQDLQTALGKAGFAKPVRRIMTNDNWAQDFVEFGYASMPAPGGAQKVIRIAIRSPQPGRAAGRMLFDLRGPGMGVVQVGGEGYHQVDSFGNLEAVPPYSHDGQTWPVGRVIYGDAGDGVAPHSDWRAFFAAQQVQAPIVLDTSWLAIGHVDEFVQFVPAPNARGWTIAVKDVDAGLALLRQAKAQGHGDVRAFSQPDAPDVTIAALLADPVWLRHNELARRKIAINLEILQAATGVRDEEILRVPGLFGETDFHAYVNTVAHKATAAPGGNLPPDVLLPPENITYGPGELIGYYPAPVNGLLIDAHHYIAPRQWGPVIDGQDILAAAVTKAYAAIGIETQFVDDWHSHHMIGGEVHCGTNATRTIGKPWWQ